MRTERKERGGEVFQAEGNSDDFHVETKSNRANTSTALSSSTHRTLSFHLHKAKKAQILTISLGQP